MSKATGMSANNHSQSQLGSSMRFGLRCFLVRASALSGLVNWDYAACK